jgi:hypothetical protein
VQRRPAGAIAGAVIAVVAVALVGFAVSANKPHHAPSPSAAAPSPTPSSTLPTPSPTDSPVASSSVCGSWSRAASADGQKITASYGEIRSCVKFADRWVIFTDGVYDGATNKVSQTGAILVDNCSTSVAPTTCEDGSAEHSFSDFTAYAPPVAGPVRLLAAWNAPILLVATASGDIRFNVDTGSYFTSTTQY